MSEEKKGEVKQETSTTVSTEVNKKPVVSEDAKVEESSSTLDDRISEMEKESIKVDGTSTDTPSEKNEVLKSEPTPVQEYIPAVATKAVDAIKSETEDGLQNNKTIVALVAGIIIGALLVYLLL